MKYFNIYNGERVELCCENEIGKFNLTAAGCPADMGDVVSGRFSAEKIGAYLNAPVCGDIKYADVAGKESKLLCVGLNYRAHADGVKLESIKENPILFSKFNNALAPSGAAVELPEWECTYDYEAELVIVIGKQAWNVSVENADDYIFGYTAGNDFSCRAAQKRSSQWLIGKSLPGFGPCGPCIVTKDELDVCSGISIKSYVNGELRQDGTTSDMIFSCAEIISYASKYICLEPGDLIFTGTPAGVQLENESGAKWLKPGDRVDVEIEGIGTLTNFMV